MKKVTDEELKNLQNLRDVLLEIIATVGELHLSKFLLDKQMMELVLEIENQQNRFVEFQEQERVLLEQLQKKYGVGNIDMETGEITE